MSLLASWLASPPLDAAIEIAPEAVSIAVLGGRQNPTVQGYAVEPLPIGAVSPSLMYMNISDRTAVVQALRAACESVGVRPRRAALVIPDLTAKVSLVRFEQTPNRRDDLDQMIRWQMKKSTPFSIDDACVTHSPGAKTAEGSEFLVVAARRDAIREYEGVCQDAGIEAGLIDLSTLAVVNLLLASGSPSGDWLVVHMRPEFTSIVILRREDVIFFRNRSEGDEEQLQDVVHQTSMYYQDRLNGKGFSRVLLGGIGRTPGAVDLARRSIEEHMATVVEPIDPTRAAQLTDRIHATPELMATLSPLIGMLLRTRTEAVAI